MRDVAGRAGVALGTLYRYFNSKDHLLAACQAEQVKAIRARLRRRPVPAGSPYERVMAVVDRATRAMERSPRATAAMLRAITSPDPAVVPCQAEAFRFDGRDARRRHGRRGALAARRRDPDPGHVWFSSLLGWVNGWSTVGRWAELEGATGSSWPTRVPAPNGSPRPREEGEAPSGPPPRCAGVDLAVPDGEGRRDARAAANSTPEWRRRGVGEQNTAPFPFVPSGLAPR